jgi:hypothetical protein
MASDGPLISAPTTRRDAVAGVPNLDQVLLGNDGMERGAARIHYS